jgi:hypothetical protein
MASGLQHCAIQATRIPGLTAHSGSWPMSRPSHQATALPCPLAGPLPAVLRKPQLHLLQDRNPKNTGTAQPGPRVLLLATGPAATSGHPSYR